MAGQRLKLFAALAVLAALSSVGGCPSPSGPPVPPAEIPSLVAFPQSVGIDVSKAGEGPSAALRTEATRKDQSDITDFSDVISLGPVIFNGFSVLLDAFLGPLSDLEIPVSTTITTFEGPMAFTPGAIAVVKIDFTDFDLDDDGALEGCSGCTCPTGCAPSFTACPSEAPVTRLKPVCYRIWLRDVGETEFVRFAAGRIDRYAVRDDPATEASEENAGEGRFRLGVNPRPAPDGTTNPLSFGVFYDHLDETDFLKKQTEFFVKDTTLDSGRAEKDRLDVHAFVTQEDATGAGDPSSLKKTVKLDQRFNPDPEDGPAIVQYIGRFRSDADFWSGTFNLEDITGVDPKKVSEENVCARISTGGEVGQGNCLDLGIDVTGEEFLLPSQDANVTFPSGFPQTPTF